MHVLVQYIDVCIGLVLYVSKIYTRDMLTPVLSYKIESWLSQALNCTVMFSYL